jgi:hypothetical protein
METWTKGQKPERDPIFDMDAEQKLKLALFAMLMAAVVFLGMFVLMYNVAEGDNKVKLILKGATPKQVFCAFDADRTQVAACGNESQPVKVAQ